MEHAFAVQKYTNVCMSYHCLIGINTTLKIVCVHVYIIYIGVKANHVVYVWKWYSVKSLSLTEDLGYSVGPNM